MRDRVVNTAREWIGTRFMHQGRLKKTKMSRGGCDCLGLLVGVARDLELRTHQQVLLHTMDNASYGKIHRQNDRLFNKLSHLFAAKPFAQAKIGDILLMSLDCWPHHIGILANINHEATIIHACSQLGAVTERILDKHWQDKIHTTFDLLSGIAKEEVSAQLS